MPFANKRLIDAEEVREIIEEMRECLPEEIKRARYIDNERDKIISEANEKANQIVDTAEDRSNSLMQSTNARVQTLISEHNITQGAMKKAEEILRKANEKANTIINNAQKKADNLSQATNEYIIKNLVNSERTLNESLENVQKTKAVILKAQKHNDTD
jgi:cell division septum initiation protein DivIVA